VISEEVMSLGFLITMVRFSPAPGFNSTAFPDRFFPLSHMMKRSQERYIQRTGKA
jgi:hypothetical protein